MSTTPHLRARLSAYLDDALSAPERADVDAHLSTCADCRARLADLRATAALIRALPTPAPTRRLVPRVRTAPAWLAPLRTLSSVASGVSVFLFVATVLLSSMQGVGTTAAAPAAAQDRATSATGAAGGATGPAAGAARNDATAAPALGAPAPSATPAPPTVSVGDATKQATPSGAAEFSAASTQPQTGVSASDTRAVQRGAPSLGSPWLWLAVAVLTGALAIGLQRRLRSA